MAAESSTSSIELWRNIPPEDVKDLATELELATRGCNDDVKLTRVYEIALELARLRRKAFREMEMAIDLLHGHRRFFANLLEMWQSRGRQDLGEVVDAMCVREATTQLSSSPSDGLTEVLTRLFDALDVEAGAAPLPIELLQQVLAEVDPSAARRLLSAAVKLPIWSGREELRLRMQQALVLADGPRDGDYVRTHVLPAARRLVVSSEPGSRVRTWAATWLVEFAEDPTRELILEALGGSPADTRPGHYCRRLRLALRRRPVVEPLLREAIPQFIDAWGLLGKDRLADRAAVCMLLSWATQEVAPDMSVRLGHEAARLHGLLSRDEQATLGAIPKFAPGAAALPESAPLADADPAVVSLLRQSRAKDAWDYLQPPPDKVTGDPALMHSLLMAEAARKAVSTAAALEALDEAEKHVHGARPELVWALHYQRAAIHWSRRENHSGLVAINKALHACGHTASLRLLHATHILRQRLAHLLFLKESTCPESDLVIDAIEQLMNVAGEPCDDRKQLHIGRALGFGLEDARYRDTLTELRQLRDAWEKREIGPAPSAVEQEAAGKALVEQRLKLKDIERLEPQEPLLVAQLRFDWIQLAFAARIRWRANHQIYVAELKPALDAAIGTASGMGAYRLLDTIFDALEGNKTVLGLYERPNVLECPQQEQRADLAQTARLLAAAQTRLERRQILNHANERCSEFLDRHAHSPMEAEVGSTLLDLLQELKQPSLEEGSSFAAIRSASTVEEVPTDDNQGFLESPLNGAWRDAVADRLQREQAICLDLLVDGGGLHAFVLSAADGELRAEFRSYRSGQFRQRSKRWRRDLASMVPLYTIKEDLGKIDGSLMDNLRDRPSAQLTGFFRGALRDRKTNVIYVGPSGALHGLPLHAILTSDGGWSLSQHGAVMHVSKARQLATAPRPRPERIRIVSGHDPNFKAQAEALNDRLSKDRGGLPSELVYPTTRGQLQAALSGDAITVLFAHGTVDKDYPWRSRLRFGRSLYLTVREIQELGLDGNEIVLLSCWAGWSFRSRLPMGELIGGPSAWMAGGAGAVLAPLWYVHIKSGAHFIGNYLKARSSGKRRSTSIQAARDAASSNAEDRICSASFVLSGCDAE